MKIKGKKSVLGWHCIKENRLLKHEPGMGPVYSGCKRYLERGTKTIMCARGYHACKSLDDCFEQCGIDTDSFIVCRVRLEGRLKQNRKNLRIYRKGVHTKMVGASRTVLWMVNAKEIINKWYDDRCDGRIYSLERAVWKAIRSGKLKRF